MTDKTTEPNELHSDVVEAFAELKRREGGLRSFQGLRARLDGRAPLPPKWIDDACPPMMDEHDHG